MSPAVLQLCYNTLVMEKYERISEKKFCYFIKDYVYATLIMHRWMIADDSWQQEEKGIECPNAKKCRRAEHNCKAVHPDGGTDPFIPFTNLLRDLW